MFLWEAWHGSMSGHSGQPLYINEQLSLATLAFRLKSQRRARFCWGVTILLYACIRRAGALLTSLRFVFLGTAALRTSILGLSGHSPVQACRYQTSAGTEVGKRSIDFP
jgi:hypothetical protein